MQYQPHRLVWNVLFIFGLLLNCTIAFAQTGKISGKVVDAQTRSGLPGVNVIVTGTTLGAATDDDGGGRLDDSPDLHHG